MIFVPCQKPEDWKCLLAEEKHWKEKFSAHSLAYTWQNASGFPVQVKKLFFASGLNEFSDIEMILGIPEYKVTLPGGSRKSQNDLLVLARTKNNLIVIMVEGKVSESFGPLIKDWKNEITEGKVMRLSYLQKLLNLEKVNIDDIRYQLLHRTASAVLTARQFNAKIAFILIHSFSDKNDSFEDYQKYLRLYGLQSQIDKISGPVNFNGIKTFWGWVKDKIPIS